MSVIEPERHPETVEVLLDTTWRVASAESGRTEALDRKAATVASFAAVIATLTATLGLRLVEQEPGWWTLVPFVTGLAALVGAVGFSLQALRPKEHVGLAMEYVRTFPTWSQILKRPEQVRGEAMRGLIQTIALGRSANERRSESIRRSFSLLFIGLVLVAGQGATLAIREVIA